MNLKLLTDTELHGKLKNFALQERRLLHIIILHIEEAARRNLYVSFGRKSLFDYLILDLGYTNGTAQRRLEAAYLLKDIPDLCQKLELGSVKLLHVGELYHAIKEKQKQSKIKIQPSEKVNLLAKIENKNGYETQKILAKELDLKIRHKETKRVQKDGSVDVRLRLSKELHEKLMKCQDLAAHKILKDHASLQLVNLLEVLADSFLEEQTPSTSKMEVKKQKSKVQTQPYQNLEFSKNIPQDKRELKSVTPLMRKQVLHRDGSCQHVDKLTGKCGSTFGLEADHIQPQWAGGKNTLGNLQALCSQHNKLKYQKESGIRKL